MKYTFKDITNGEIYDSASVMFVTGQYNIFNNIVIDEIRDRCIAKEIPVLDTSLLDEFGIDISEMSGVKVSNSVDFDTFINSVASPSLTGKWFCNTDYSFLSKKQREKLMNYLKSPFSTGKLVVGCSDYRDYKVLLRHKIIINSPSVHLIQLNYPYRDILTLVVKSLFENRRVNIEPRAVELFIMRMSNSYDDYEEVIDKIVSESVPQDTPGQDPNWVYTITYDDTLSAMKGIENFVLDDFIDRILIPLNSDKTNGKNKVYRMLSSLMEEFGAEQLVQKLRRKIDDYIEFRLAINSGIIPVKVRFSIPEAKGRLPENHPLQRFSDYTFRKMAITASKTSLKDWFCMKMILTNIQYKYDVVSYERALYSLVNRSVLSESRLSNDIGMSNILNEFELRLNKVVYDETKLIHYNN